jgi:ABC-type multidrug transport system fused ATPase/permease subunit
LFKYTDVEPFFARKLILNMKILLEKTFQLLSKKEKAAFLVLTILMVITSAVEVVGLAMILPFFKLLENPLLIQQNAYLLMVFEFLGKPSTNAFLTLLGIALILLMALKSIYVYFVGFLQSILLLKVQMRLEGILLNSYLHRSLEFHFTSNPATLFQNVRTVQAINSAFLMPLVSVVSELLVALSMFSFLVIFKTKITLVSLVFVLFLGSIFWLISRKKLYRYGLESHEEGARYVKWLNQSFYGIKDIKVSNTQQFFLDKYVFYSYRYAKLLQKSNLINQSIKPILEAFGFAALISYVLYQLNRSVGLSALMPTMMVFAGAAFRMLPAANRILSNLAFMRQNHKVANDILNDLNAGKLAIEARSALVKKEVSLNKKITLNHVSFSYEGAGKNAIDQLDFSIMKGDFIGIVGPSGAGKTTLVDLILGLLPNYQGEILVDDQQLSFKDGSWQSWQKKIGYVPQNVYLYDDSILKNVAFGIPEAEIDTDRVIEALKLAKLYEWVSGLPDQLNSQVGDRGVRVSGGQKQRIGIARAFYRNSELLVLDEVTSALDEVTENEMIEELKRLNSVKTILMITHKPSALRYCNKVFSLNSGKLLK